MARTLPPHRSPHVLHRRAGSQSLPSRHFANDEALAPRHHDARAGWFPRDVPSFRDCQLRLRSGAHPRPLRASPPVPSGLRSPSWRTPGTHRRVGLSAQRNPTDNRPRSRSSESAWVNSCGSRSPSGVELTITCTCSIPVRTLYTESANQLVQARVDKEIKDEGRRLFSRRWGSQRLRRRATSELTQSRSRNR